MLAAYIRLHVEILKPLHASCRHIETVTRFLSTYWNRYTLLVEILKPLHASCRTIETVTRFLSKYWNRYTLLVEILKPLHASCRNIETVARFLSTYWNRYTRPKDGKVAKVSHNGSPPRYTIVTYTWGKTFFELNFISLFCLRFVCCLIGPVHDT